MTKATLIMAPACFVLSALIFLLADGMRALYSGGFFLVLGLAVLGNRKS